ncbi:MAG: hypothetical protein JOZ29_20620 [Deltaproteobacteria bacterium]|nr:hypothetical protein [Deltaproteobacteria bacterium]
MKILVLAAFLAAGCSTANNPTDGTYRKCAKLRSESREILERERQCIRATTIRNNDQIAQIAAAHDPNAPTGLRTQIVANDRDRELAKCKANADREENELSACQRAEYKSQANDERERNALMMILTTSLPR